MTSNWELTPLAQLVVIATGLIPLASDAPPVLSGLWLIAVVCLWGAGIGRDHDDHDIGWPR